MPKVKEDIIGACSGTLYAKAGTDVTTIHINHNMALVQDGDGNKFHVRVELLTDDPAQVSEAVPVIENPAPAIHKKSKKKTKGTSQQNLF